MSRLPLLQKDEISPEYHDVFGAGMNLHRLTLHSPRLARLSRQLGLYFRKDSDLPTRLCELAIIHVAWLARSAYEYSHHIKIALDAGIDESEISAAASASSSAAGLDPLLRSVLEAARQMVEDGGIDDKTYAGLSDLSPDQTVDLLFVISFYAGFVRFTNSLRIDVEPEYQQFLERFPLPS